MAQVNFLLEVATPSRLLVSKRVEEMSAPGILGEFGVLPGHAPFLTALGLGELMFRVGMQKTYLAVRSGFAEVTPGKVIVLAEEADFLSDIDLEAAEQAKIEAEKALDEFDRDSTEYQRAQIELDRANNRIMVATRRAGGEHR